MFPPFSQEIALHYLRLLTASLNSGEAYLKQLARESEERRGQGLMLGCLVCTASSSLTRRVLFAVSGLSKELVLGASFCNETSPVYTVVPAIVGADSIEKALSENDLRIHQLTDKIKASSDAKLQASLREERSLLTTASLKNVFKLYNFTRFDGKVISLNSIIESHQNRLPPTGTGDCCAPKLLSYAFSHGLKPVSMAELYYGGKLTVKKVPGQLYPPCDERCGFILPHMLGFDILYRDRDIIVINKASGLLSVPGRGEDKADCAESRLRSLFSTLTGENACTLQQPAVHRLDMETSGILIMALNKEAHAALEKQFEQGLVKKKYIALLDGILHGKNEGRIELKFRLDLKNRPKQIYDEEQGKLGITLWSKKRIETFINPQTGEKKKVTRIEFIPLTGRTHQLRLAASSPFGLKLPIVGDSLYGKKKDGERLMLHSCEIEFEHPRSNRKMKLYSPPDF